MKGKRSCVKKVKIGQNKAARPYLSHMAVFAVRPRGVIVRKKIREDFPVMLTCKALRSILVKTVKTYNHEKFSESISVGNPCRGCGFLQPV
jgi:hypothetical protein